MNGLRRSDGNKSLIDATTSLHLFSVQRDKLVINISMSGREPSYPFPGTGGGGGGHIRST